MITAQCHCGNINIKVENIPDTMTECNCSICRRLAAKWLYYGEKEAKTSYNLSQPKSYVWGDKEIFFHHCSICGCNTHYSSTGKSDLDRIAINANMLAPDLLENIKIRRFNGADM